MIANIGALLIASVVVRSMSCKAPTTTYVRPALITKALETNKNVYYLGVGSNLLKEKVVNRGVNGSTISICSFRPARVENHRLAFNMRGKKCITQLTPVKDDDNWFRLLMQTVQNCLGFLPLEPSMGGIEVCEGSSCHGALMEMKASEVQLDYD